MTAARSEWGALWHTVVDTTRTGATVTRCGKQFDLADTADEPGSGPRCHFCFRDGINSTEVCDLTGVTYRQLNHWVITGLVTPSLAAAEGSGTQRMFSDEDVAEIALIKHLVDLGVEISRIRRDGDPLRTLDTLRVELAALAEEYADAC